MAWAQSFHKLGHNIFNDVVDVDKDLETQAIHSSDTKRELPREVMLKDCLFRPVQTKPFSPKLV